MSCLLLQRPLFSVSILMDQMLIDLSLPFSKRWFSFFTEQISPRRDEFSKGTTARSPIF